MRFFSFLVCFFHTTRFFFASIRYRSIATTLRPPYFKPYRHPNDGLSHTKSSRRPRGHPILLICSFILYRGFTPFHIFHQVMAITIFPTHLSLGEFRLTRSVLHHFPETPLVLKFELKLDIWRCVDFYTFNFHYITLRTGSGIFLNLPTFLFLVSGSHGADV